MADTSIEWAANPDGSQGKVWNPTRGCTKVSPGCKNCYAETFAERWRGVPGHPYERGFDPRLVPEKLGEPLKWRKPQTVFVNSMSDLFMEEVTDDYLDTICGVMAACRYIARAGRNAIDGHTFIVLTKRGERLRDYLSQDRRAKWARAAAYLVGGDSDGVFDQTMFGPRELPNVRWGVSVEDRKYGLPRIEHLRKAPAACRVLSIEPLLEDLGELDLTGIGWVLVGGESGPGARPFDIEWARSIVRQCRAANVPVFVKQLGANVAWNGMAGPGHGDHWPDATDHEDTGRGYFRMYLEAKKGGAMAEWPADLRVREVPANG